MRHHIQKARQHVKTKLRKHEHLLRNIVLGFAGFFALLGGVTLIWMSTLKLPDFSSFESVKQANSSKIYDRTGTVVLYDLGSDVRRTTIPVAEMGDTIKQATVAIEDANFYSHAGIRPTSMVRALIADIRHVSAAQGGSTITQQVIKKTLLTDRKSPVRKLKEIVLALKLDREYEKEDILGMYLNVIPYGGNVYGIAEASRMFFGKETKDLTLAEAAYLAAIPNAPTRFSPYGSNRDKLETRKNLVLSRELELGYITQAQYDAAKAERVAFLPQQGRGIKAPHFVFYVKDYLEERYGADMVESGGLKIITTLDYELQQIGEKAVADYTIGDHKQGVAELNAGLVAMDPKTGQILAMVGSRDYFDKTIDGNYNVALAKRQPGSSFKPYMYVTALEQGYTPDTVLFDVATEFNTYCTPYGTPSASNPSADCYMPENYDGTYHGPMDVRTALGSSINVPAVKLLYLVGMKNTIKTAQDLGITTLGDYSRYGLSLVLGGGEVRLVDAVGAYATFAAEGVRHPYAAVLSVEDRNGAKLEEWQDQPVTVLSRNAVLQLTDVLSDNNARRLTFSPTSPLWFPDRQVAAKTGTTNDFKDLWTIGYTPSLVAGIWAGRNDSKPLYKGISGSPIWHQFMAEALKKYPNETFEKPDPDPQYADLAPVLRGFWEGGKSFVVDTVTGMLATEQTPANTRKEYVITDVHDILYWIDKENPRGPAPARPQNDPMFHNWETAVRDWWARNAYRFPVITEASRPTGYDTVHTKENAPQVAIVSPASGTSFDLNDTITVSVTSAGTYPLAKMDVFLDGRYAGTASGAMPVFSFVPSHISGTMAGPAMLTVTATNTIGLSMSTEVDIVIR